MLKRLAYQWRNFLAWGNSKKQGLLIWPILLLLEVALSMVLVNSTEKSLKSSSKNSTAKWGLSLMGVHIPSWESPETDNLWCHCCGEQRWYGTLETLEKEFGEIDDEKLWALRSESRKKLIDYAKKRLEKELPKRGEKLPKNFLNPNVLTIGFSRRFATYKRVDLLLYDEERLLKLPPGNKVQIIVAGKAHPADKPGQALIEKWVQFTSLPEVAPYAAFLSDYDILLAERLVQGMDLWVNTPRRPWEASGTSGMKVLVNGGLNFSSLDGWWAEAYTPDVGWALKGEEDTEDAKNLIDTLENEIIPLYYKQG